MKHLQGQATEFIPAGASVLVRGMKVSLAPAEIANAIAQVNPWGKGWARGD